MERFILLALMLFSAPVMAGEHLLNPMLGVTDWSRNNGHSINGGTINFDNDAPLTLGFKYLYRFDNGLALGGSYSGYSKDVSNTAVAHEADVANVHGVLQYYFTPQAPSSAYLGVGLGGMGMTFDGGSLDGHSTAGTSLQLNAGMLFKLAERYGLQFEYQYNSFDVDESIHSNITRIETYSHSLLVGVTIHL
ncbi:MAG: outer membrane beta-barrel protein [Gammaproteobacteria bacterium]